jgi:hypothetical protein
VGLLLGSFNRLNSGKDAAAAADDDNELTN